MVSRFYKLQKGIPLLLLSFIIVLTLVGCGEAQDTILSTNDKVFVAELSDNEKELVGLLGVHSDIGIFSYKVTEGKYKFASIWMEAYKDGELISKDSELSPGNRGMSTPLNREEGKIAVIADDDFKFAFQTAGGYSGSKVGDDWKDVVKGYPRAVSRLSNDVEIISGEEIVLTAFLYNESGSISSYPTEYFKENPELLREYDYAFLIKCSFLTE